MTEIANECLLGSYGVASQIVHMTATEPLGPWRRVGVALAGFAHNPQVREIIVRLASSARLLSSAFSLNTTDVN